MYLVCWCSCFGTSVLKKFTNLKDEVGWIKADSKQCLSDYAEIKNEIATFKDDTNKTVKLCLNQLSDVKTKISAKETSISNCAISVENLESEYETLKKKGD